MIDPRDDTIDFDIMLNTLRERLKEFCSPGSYADAIHISRSHLYRVLARDELPSKKLLFDLGIGQYTVRGYYKLEDKKP